MARGPHHHHRPGNPWTRFFLGSPRNFFLTLVGAFVVLAMFRRDVAEFLLGNAVNAVVGAVAPAVDELIAIGLVILLFWFIIQKIRGH